MRVVATPAAGQTPAERAQARAADFIAAAMPPPPTPSVPPTPAEIQATVLRQVLRDLAEVLSKA